MNEVMLQIVQGKEKLYPHHLEKHFPRLLSQIVSLWETPNFDAFMSDLMINSRHDRQGFPFEVAQELHLLSQIRERTRGQPQPAATPTQWENIAPEYRAIIEGSGFACSAQGFLKATENSNRKVVTAFLSGGGRVDVRDERGWTPLMIAAFNGNEEVARLLIASGASLSVIDNSGYNPLHWAAFNGHTGMVRLLLEKHLHPDSRSQHGWTPLLQAATRGHLQAAAALIDGGADVNLASNDGWTPLHKACANGHVEVVKVLLFSNANRNATQPDGATPLALAIKNNHKTIIPLFQ